ncbi:MAG: alginate lyase family protein [Bryobacteraceae bacterium]|nr:alginate lyase family protein [Bryobacteraceae bacterium]
MLRPVLLAAATLALAAAAPPPRGTLLLTEADLTAIKALNGTSHARIEAIRVAADKARQQQPWSVTSHRPEDTPAGLHDFYSEGPYWWPDPKNPRGPYIRRDGETNPDRFTANDRDLKNMCDAVLALGAASWLIDKPEYARRAAEIVSVWFLSEDTRMNPSLQFGQAVHGRTTGRPEGLIATRSFIWLLEGVRLAERSSGWDPKVSAGLKAWMRDFLHWMTTSEIGRGEGGSGNNHASWWTAQGSAMAIYIGDHGARDRMFEHYRSTLLKQFQPDGSAPREEARTKSLSYSMFNALALSMTARMAQVQGKDIANYANRDGVGLHVVARYLAPFLTSPTTWTNPQITKFEADKEHFAGLAGLALNKPELLRAQRKLGVAGGTAADLLSLLFEVTW